MREGASTLRIGAKFIMRRIAAVIAASALAALALPGAAHAAPPNPFGHACTPQNGVLFCPTVSLGERIPSFDGVPLDVDVTLPPTGDGPFPTIVMLHGYPGTKATFETTTPEGGASTLYHYNNIFYAQQGYAVLNYSARGFGRSCGVPGSRTAGCERGWLHLNDQRFEAHDTQYLLGLLVDQGVAAAGKLGATGISYGSGQSYNLAFLRNRVRRENGAFVPWTSPAGTPLEISAAYPRWSFYDLAAGLIPNGRFRAFDPPDRSSFDVPSGIMKQSWVDALFLGGQALGFLAPQGVDPSANLEGWKKLLDGGEPYGADLREVEEEIFTFHDASGLSGRPAPLLIQNGWTDDLFPVPQALRVYNLLANNRRASVSLQLGDLGHARGSNKTNADRFFNDKGAAFFDALLKGEGEPPANRSVTAFTQTCPQKAPADGPFEADDYSDLHPGAVRFGTKGSQRVTSSGGSAKIGEEFDPIGGGGDACKSVDEPSSDAGTATLWKRSTGFTMLGPPTVRATIDTDGNGGELNSRLWDVDSKGEQTLISRGAYRLRNDQKGTVRFQLWGNGWEFERDHTIKLELVGRDANYLRASNDSFSVRVSDLKVELPTREKPGRDGILRPQLGK